MPDAAVRLKEFFRIAPYGKGHCFPLSRLHVFGDADSIGGRRTDQHFRQCCVKKINRLDLKEMLLIWRVPRTWPSWCDA